MRMLKVGKDFWINAEDIEIIQLALSRAAEREKKKAQQADSYYDATGRKKLLSVLTLKNGWVVGSPFLPDVLVSRPTVAAPSRGASRGARREEMTEAVAADRIEDENMTEASSKANGKG